MRGWWNSVSDQHHAAATRFNLLKHFLLCETGFANLRLFAAIFTRASYTETPENQVDMPLPGGFDGYVMLRSHLYIGCFSAQIAP